MVKIVNDFCGCKSSPFSLHHRNPHFVFSDQIFVQYLLTYQFCSQHLLQHLNHVLYLKIIKSFIFRITLMKIEVVAEYQICLKC